MATLRIQGDEITLDNIASESTQQDVLRALGGAAATAGGLGGALSSTGEAAEGTSGIMNRLTGIFTGTAAVAGNLTQQLYAGNASLGTMSASLEKFPVLGDTLGKLTSGLISHGQGLVENFQQLSTVGGGFSGDIFEMKNAAAQARMTLPDFSAAIMKNASDLAALGGSVNQGSRAFSNFSQSFYDNNEPLVRQLMEMGLSTEAINEQLLYQARMNRRFDLTEPAARQAAIHAAVALSTEMDELAKLTGMQKDEIQAEIEASKRKGQVEAKFRQIEMEQGAEAAQAARAAYDIALANAVKAGPDAVAALEETFALGQISSQQARTGAVALGSAFDDLQAMALDIRGYSRGMTTEIATSRASGLADSFDSALVARMNDPSFLSQATLAAAGNEYGQGAATLLEAAGNFETASQRQVDIAEEQALAGTPGGDTTRIFNESAIALNTMTAQLNEELLGDAGAIQSFAGELRAAGTALQEFNAAGGGRDFVAEAAQEISELLGIGSAITSDDGNAGQQPEGTVEGRNALNEIKNVIGNITAESELQQENLNTLIVALTSLSGAVASDTASALKQQAEEDNMSLQEKIQQIVDREGTAEGIMGTLSESQQSTARAIIEALEEGDISREMLIESLTATVQNMIVNASNVSGFSGGTLGELGSLFGDFGQGTLAMLHGKEAVVTPQQMSGLLNQAAGAATQMLSEAANQPQMQEIASSLQNNMGNSGGTLAEKLDNLNQTMLQLVNINMQVNDTARRQLKGIKGMSGNVMTGFSV